MYVARDKDGTLSFFVVMPVRYEDSYWGESDFMPSLQDSCTLPKHMFEDLKWEDEPLCVDLVANKPIKFRLSDEAKAIIEKDCGKTIEELRHTPLNA